MYQIKQCNGRTTSFLRQSISTEIQRGNCARILGTVESPKLLEELFDLFDTKSDHYHSYGCFNYVDIFSYNVCSSNISSKHFLF